MVLPSPSMSQLLTELQIAVLCLSSVWFHVLRKTETPIKILYFSSGLRPPEGLQVQRGTQARASEADLSRTALFSSFVPPLSGPVTSARKPSWIFLTYSLQPGSITILLVEHSLELSKKSLVETSGNRCLPKLVPGLTPSPLQWGRDFTLSKQPATQEMGVKHPLCARYSL